MRLLLTGAVAAFIACVAPAFPSASDDVLARSRAMYASLKSYADTGVVLYEYGNAASPVRDQHTFKTFFRKPRHFYFDFLKGGKPGGERVVVWSDDHAFHSWGSGLGIENTYPKGTGNSAFVTSIYPTYGSIVMISPLLFPGAGLIGALEEFEPSGVEGVEIVAGRKCHKVAGIAKSRYISGREVNVRRMTAWIDAETLLVRKVLEDTPRGSIAGTVARRTTSFDPQANPTLDDARFRFTPPATQ